jgi:hypothetical protein
VVVYGSHEERERIVCVAELGFAVAFIISKRKGTRVGGVVRTRRTLPAMMASSGASNVACSTRRAFASDASYALDVCRNSAVRRRACLAGDVGVVASK